jgi:hypothetical protein
MLRRNTLAYYATVLNGDEVKIYGIGPLPTHNFLSKKFSINWNYKLRPQFLIKYSLIFWACDKLN